MGNIFDSIKNWWKNQEIQTEKNKQEIAKMYSQNNQNNNSFSNGQNNTQKPKITIGFNADAKANVNMSNAMQQTQKQIQATKQKEDSLDYKVNNARKSLNNRNVKDYTIYDVSEYDNENKFQFIDFDSKIKEIDKLISQINSQRYVNQPSYNLAYATQPQQLTTEQQKQINDLKKYKQELKDKKDWQDKYIATYTLDRLTDKTNPLYNEQDAKDYADLVASYDDYWLERASKYLLGSIPLSIAGGALTFVEAFDKFTKDKAADAMIKQATTNFSNGKISQEDVDAIIEKANEIKGLEDTDDSLGIQLTKWSNQLAQQSFYGDKAQIVDEILFQTVDFLSRAYIEATTGIPMLATYGLQSFGSTYEDVLSKTDENGNPKYTQEQAFGNATVHGAISIITELFGFDRAVKFFGTGLGQNALAEVLISSFGEGFEELEEDWANKHIDYIQLGTPIEYNYGDLARTFLIASASGALGTAYQGGVYKVKTYKQAQALQNELTNLEKLRPSAIAYEEQLPGITQTLNDIENEGRMALNKFESNYSGALKGFKNNFQQTTLDEDINTLKDSIKPDIEELLDFQTEVARLKNSVNTIATNFLAMKGVNMDANQYIALDENDKQNVMKLQEDGNKLEAKLYFDSELVDENGDTVDGYYDNENEVMCVNPKGKRSAVSTLIHELVHRAKKSLAYSSLLEQTKAYYGENYQNAYNEVAKAYKGLKGVDIEEELVAITMQDLFGNEEYLNRLVKYNNSFAFRLLEGFRSLQGEDAPIINQMAFTLENAIADNRRQIDLQNNNQLAYSVKTDLNNNKYIELDTDIFDGYPQSDWINVFDKYMRNNYIGQDINAFNQIINIDKQSIREMEYSNYSKYLKNNDQNTYYDKLRVLSNPIELFDVSSNWINEEPNHNRKDNIKNFARANVLYKTPINDYKAELIVGLDKDNNAKMYDLVKIVPTQIKRGSISNTSQDITVKEENTNTASSNKTIPQSNSNLSNNGNKYSKAVELSKTLDFERTPDLLAIHNLSEDKLRKSIELGGFAMPSIAITKDSMDNNNFGNISLIFDKSSIDPKNPKNEVFSGDAWTSVYPTIDYDVSYKSIQGVRDYLNSIANREEVSDIDNDSILYRLKDKSNLDDFLTDNGGNITDKLDSSDALRYMFLKENGIEVKKPYKQLSVLGLENYKDDKAMLKKILDTGLSLEEYQKGYEEVKKYIEPIRQIVNDYYAEKYPDLKEEFFTKEEFGFSHADKYIDAAIRYLKDSNYKEQRIDDKKFKSNLNKAIAQYGENFEQDYKNWYTNLLSKYEIRSGIRNDTDIFYPDGSRRTFKQTHDEYTLKNLLKYMKKNSGADSRGVQTIFGVGTGDTLATQLKSFDDLADIISNENLIQNLTEEQFDEVYEPLRDELNSIHDLVFESFDKLGKKTNEIKEVDAIVSYDNNSREFVKEMMKFDTKEQMDSYYQREFAPYDSLNISEEARDEIYGQILDLKNKLNNLPTKYFEAKPRRIVGLDEIKTAIIPNNTSEDIKQSLNDLGAKIVEYNPNVDGDRQLKLKAQNNIKFSKGVAIDELGKTTELTKSQQKFFDKSKARDDNGRLLTLYHGTSNAGFTIFDDKINIYEDENGHRIHLSNSYVENNPNEVSKYKKIGEEIKPIFMTTSKEDADSYGGNDYTRNGFEKGRIFSPDMETEYQTKVATIKDIVKYPNYFTKEDIIRAVDNYDSNNAYDMSLTKEEMLDGLRAAINDPSEEGFGDVEFETTSKKGKDATRHDNSATYKLYANIENPYIVNLFGQNAENSNNNMYQNLQYALNNGYDGLIAKNTRLGRYKNNGTVVIAFRNDQVKSVDNLNPTKDRDIRFSKGVVLDENESRQPGPFYNRIKAKRDINSLEKINKGEILTEEEFYHIYDSHIMNYGRTDKPNTLNNERLIKEGFTQGWTMPSISYSNPSTYDYGWILPPAKDDTVILVSRDYVSKNGTIEGGYRPHQFEVLTMEKNRQPLYEAYKKNFEKLNDVKYSKGVKLKDIPSRPDIVKPSFKNADIINNATYIEQIKETDKAILLGTETGEEIWIPKSVIDMDALDYAINGRSDFDKIEDYQAYKKATSKEVQEKIDSYLDNIKAYKTKDYSNTEVEKALNERIAEEESVGYYPGEEQAQVDKEKEYQKLKDEDIKKISKEFQKDKNLAKEENRKMLDEVVYKIRQYAINGGEEVSRISKEYEKPQLEADYDMLKRANSITQNILAEGRYDNEGKKIGKSFKEIWQPIQKSGKEFEFNRYMYNLLNVDTMKQGKPVFDETITSEISQRTASMLELENPEFKEWAKEIYAFNNANRKYMVERGLISQKTANEWAKMYPHYVPIVRAMDINENFEQEQKIATSNKGALKKRVGGKTKLQPLDFAIANKTEKIIRSGLFNTFANDYFDTLDGEGAIDFPEFKAQIDSDIEHLQKNPDTNQATLIMYDGGSPRVMNIDSRLYDSLNNEKSWLDGRLPVLSQLTSLRTNLITGYNPVFWLTNGIKDIQDVFANSKYLKDFATLYPQAWKDVILDNPNYKLYKSLGGQGSSYFAQDTKEGKSKYEGAYSSKGKNILQKGADGILALNELIETMPRYTEFLASLKNGETIEQAMLNSAEITTNFKRGGKLTKALNRNGFNFLNASVQGADKIVRNWKDAYDTKGMKGVLKYAGKLSLAYGLPLIILNALIWKDDKDYEDLSDYIKENYYIVGKYGDGKFVRIPKGRLANSYQSIMTNTLDSGKAITEGDWDRVLENLIKTGKNVIDNVAPNNPIDNNILSPIFQVAANKNWYGEELLPDRIKREKPIDQYDESTSSIAMGVSNFLNNLGIETSPYKINYLLDQYSGGLGDFVLPMTTIKAESGLDDGTLKGKLASALLSAGVDKFTTDSILKNQNVSDFYIIKEEFYNKSQSSSATDEEILASKYLNSASYQMNQLYAEKRKIQYDENLTDKEKYDKTRDIQDLINKLAEAALDGYDDIDMSQNYASVNGIEYYKSNGEYTKVSDKDLEITKDYTTEQKGLYFNTKEQMKSVNTKKEKTDIISSTDLDYEMKNDIYSSISNTKYDKIIDENPNLTEEEKFKAKTDKSTKATENKQMYEDMGIYDNMISYMKAKGLEPKDIGLSKSTAGISKTSSSNTTKKTSANSSTQSIDKYIASVLKSVSGSSSSSTGAIRTILNKSKTGSSTSSFKTVASNIKKIKSSIPKSNKV